MFRPVFVAVAVLLLAPAVTAQASPNLAFTSSAPSAAGDYLMRVHASAFTLVEPGSGAPNQAGSGHIAYHYNGVPCADGVAACNGTGQRAATSYAYRGLPVGAVVCAELVNHDGSSLSPPVKRCQAVGGTTLRISTPQPAVQEGKTSRDAAVSVEVKGFTLRAVPNATAPRANEPLGGHLKFLIQRPGEPEPVPCIAACSATAQFETPGTTFQYKGLHDGDRIVVRLVHNDGAPLNPPIEQHQIVGRPTISALSDEPRGEGAYTLRVDVDSYILAPPPAAGSTPFEQSGTGHIHYLIKRKDTSAFVPCEGTCAGGQPYATTALSFTYRDLKDGDVVAAELVRAGHSSFATPIRVEVGFREVLPTPGGDVTLLLAGLAAVGLALRRRA